MAVLSVHSRRQELDATFARVNGTVSDPELQAHFARYLCVVVSGFVEQSTRDILAAYAAHSPPRLARFVDRTVNRQNVNTTVLLQMVDNFDHSWREALEDYVDGGRQAALDSVVTNRHAVAHGRPTSISLHQMSAYYKSVGEIVVFLEQLCA